jgi:periplasmic protein TonB
LDISIKNSTADTKFSESTLIWAVICSILLHILFFVVVPNFKFDAIKKIPDQLTVEIVQPKKPEPVVIPEPPKPIDPIKPQPEQIKPLPKKELKLEPKPIETRPEPMQHEPPPPTVITAAPKVEGPPVITVPPPEPPKKIEPSDADINAAKNTYIQNVENELKRNHRYPKIAVQRGIQGEVKIKIIIDKEGNVVASTVLESSKNATLDEGALATVNRSNLKRFYPEILHGRDYEFTTLIAFTLTDR